MLTATGRHGVAEGRAGIWPSPIWRLSEAIGRNLRAIEGSRAMAVNVAQKGLRHVRLRDDGKALNEDVVPAADQKHPKPDDGMAPQPNHGKQI